ncbi:MAG: GTP cyclohydrolase MptA [Ardenticatenaceae bacterium]|nr:GTP cyclohydrolase MptA [Ardenticatenaceae bacterium]
MAQTHTVYLGLGSNLGDRQSNLAEAIQRLREYVRIEELSSVYETEPWGYAEQPAFLNMVIKGQTGLPPQDLLRFLKDIEEKMGRRQVNAVRYGPRPIDIDILFYDDVVLDEGRLQVPHPRVEERAFVLVPLADLAPGLVHPQLGQTVAELLATVDRSGVHRVESGLLAGFARDVQEERPRIAVSLNRVGVTGLHRVIRLLDNGRGQLFYAELDLFVDLRPEQKGAHMSRFSETVEELLDEMAAQEAPDIETLAERIARQIVAEQGAARSEVHIRAQFPLMRHAPISGKATQEIYTLIGIAAANERKSARLVGVEAEGMTACPCAQDMARAHARERLLSSGFNDAQVETALDVVPVATHNQRGRGTLLVTAYPGVRAESLVQIVEASMSSETYDLLKRPDEFFIVNRAHSNPKFVEDVVRDMLGYLVDMYPDLPDDSFVSARQTNFETIHKHDVFAERAGTVGEIRAEMAGGPFKPGPLSLSAWISQMLNGE